MIITMLQGGLGNQMFQYAFGKYLSLKNNTELKVDTHYLLDRSPRKDFFVYRDYDLPIFNINVEQATLEEVKQMTHWVSSNTLNRAIRKVIGRKPIHIYEPYFHFSEKCFNSGNNVYLEGYWQTEKYFRPIKDIIKSEFTFKNNLNPSVDKLAENIRNCNSICVNVRRGDFLISHSHGVCTPDYFMNAEKIISGKVNSPHYFVFSDDLDWCMSNLAFSSETTFVDHQYAGYKFQDYFRLMSFCKHFIIPNSTFAWWAAYLCQNEKKIVIAPKRWSSTPNCNCSDLIPTGWLKI